MMLSMAKSSINIVLIYILFYHLRFWFPFAGCFIDGDKKIHKFQINEIAPF
jgi:hypothetical protein